MTTTTRPGADRSAATGSGAADGSRRTYVNFVDGAWQRPRGGGRLDVVDPATGEVYAEAQLSRPEDVDTACEAAQAASVRWRRWTPQQRARALLAAADALEARADEYVDAECRNTGKPPSVVRADEVGGAVDCFRFAAGAARTLSGQASGDYTPHHTSLLRREPVGVVAAVTPWNYPLLMAVWKLAPALAAGNTVVLKPAETAPVTPLMLAELLTEFLPPGVVNVVCGDRQTGQALVSHPVPALVALTGSTLTGREVAAAAGPLLKRLQLELGGGALALVLDDADLDLAVDGIIGAGFYNAGQSCTAASRVLATPGVHDELVSRLADAARARRVGPPEDDPEHGPLNNASQLAAVAALVDGRSPRAEVVAGGDVLQRPGFFYASTVIAGVEPTHDLAREEVFGPVITVEQVRDTEDAVERAVGAEQRLAASVWTSDVRTAHRAAAALDTGTVWINCHSVLPGEMPHTGVGSAGAGSDLSQLAVEGYTRPKQVTLRV